ncbi:MAG: hypothetical protein QXE31_01900 [Candidatus Woesearchaeota archaeon]
MDSIIDKLTDFTLYQEGIKIKKKFLTWSEIKSISFQTGRHIADYNFYKGFKLPVFQRIYILDYDAQEYSTIIDTDYFLKNKRSQNNLLILRKHLIDMNKSKLISDWAEKR